MRIARTCPPVKFPHVSKPNEATPKSETADAIREAFISYPIGVGVPNVATALYEISRSLDRLAAAVESAGSRRS